VRLHLNGVFGVVDKRIGLGERGLMADVKADIAAYEKMQAELEDKHMGKWVLFHNEIFVAVYDSFETAAEHAVDRFGRGPFLIRQVGVASISLPASVMYRPVYG